MRRRTVAAAGSGSERETTRTASCRGEAGARASRRARRVLGEMLAGVGGEGSAEPGESAGSGATLTGQTITCAHSGNFVSERSVEVNARSRRTMTAVGPMRRVCVLVSILLLGRSRHTCDAPGSYVRFTSRLHVDTLTQQQPRVLQVYSRMAGDAEGADVAARR